MWQPLPALSGHGFGASEATRPCRAATPRIVSRTSSCSSAACSAGAWRGRDLLLAVAELGVVLLERDALRVERGDELVDVVLRRGRADRREAERRVDRHVRAVDLRRERELVLERRRAAASPRSASRASMRFRNERWQTGAGSPSSPTWSVSTAPRVRRVRQHAERLEVGDEPDLADRAHARDRLQLVERRSSPACATVRPMPLASRPSSPCRADAFARTVPSLPHQRKRTRRRPASSACLTTSFAVTRRRHRRRRQPRAGGRTR